MDKKTQGKIRTLHSAFKTVAEIAEETGIDSEIVVFALEDMGYRPRYEKDKPEPSEFLTKKDAPAEDGGKRPHYRTSAEEREKIKSLRKEGKTIQQIANLLGVKYTTVDSVLRSRKEKEKEPAPSANDASSDRDVKPVHDYHTAFSEFCQEDDRLISRLETWLDEFISEVYNYQSEEWQHGYDTGEKLSELRSLIRKAKGEQV